MKKTTIIGLIILFVGALALTSCGGPKKCGGKRGIKTPMGLM